MAIQLTQKIVQQFQLHGEKDYPHECCGFILGQWTNNGTEALEYVPAENTKDENRERRFLIAPNAYQQVEDEADKKGLAVISIVHSHPDHPDGPPGDQWQAALADCRIKIVTVSVRTRCFREPHHRRMSLNSRIIRPHAPVRPGPPIDSLGPPRPGAQRARSRVRKSVPFRTPLRRRD